MMRDEFRNQVLARDHGACVVCRAPAVDVHHIIERKLFPDGGYYLDNGVALCAAHHEQAEATIVSCAELRLAAQIVSIKLPPQLETDTEYDKWGNPVLADGRRARGELFDEPSVQALLQQAGLLDLFVPYVKYPRTPHLPWSPGVEPDDLKLEKPFWGPMDRVVATIKMDGENSTLYHDYIHARSLNPNSHISRAWLKNLHATIAHDIPTGWRICGENLYAEHSIHYRNLPSYFMVFSIWDDTNTSLTWDETVEWTRLLGLETVPVLYQGPWGEHRMKNLHWETWNGNPSEGYAVRSEGAFRFRDFRRSVAKFVRAHHVKKEQHWMHRALRVNELG